MADGRQQQDQPPPRQRGRSSLQPYQPRRHPQQQAAGAGRGRGPPAGSGTAGRRPLAQGSTAGRSARGAQAAQQPQAAAPAPATVDGLVDAAADSSKPEASRAAALQQLHQQLFDPLAQRVALQQLQVLWPRLLSLLWEDPSPAVTAAAAPAVGAIGALTAQAAAAAAAQREGTGAASASASTAGGLLFDWLLPVLQRRATPGGHTLATHQLSAVLLAVRDCLAGVDAVTLTRYANAVLAACQALLEDEGTPPAAVPALLATLQQAARHPHALKARCRDLTDLLLGWALEPALPDAARPALSRLLAAAVGAQRRQEQPGFLETLLASLLADMQRFVDKAVAAALSVQSASAAASDAGPGAGASAAATEATNSLRQVLALAACVLPLLDAAAASQLPSAQQHLAAMLGVLRQAVEAAAAAADAAAAAGISQGSSAVAPAALAVELSGHVARLAALAPAAAAAAAGSSAVESSGRSPAEQQHSSEQEAAAGEEAAAAIQQLSIAEAVDSAAAGGQQLQPPPPAAEEPKGTPPAASSATQTPDIFQQLFASVAAYAAAAAGVAGVLAQPAAVLAVLGALRSWVQMLAAQSVPPGTAAELLLPTGGGWLLGLRSYGSRDVVLQAAQLLLPLLQHSHAALEALAADIQLQAAQLQAAASSQPAVAAAAAALRFDVQLLQAAVAQLPQPSVLVLWQQLLPLARPPTPLAAVPADQPGQPPHRLWLALLVLLQAAGQRLVDSRQLKAGSTQREVLALLTSLLGQPTAAPEPVLLQALQWLEQAAAWPLDAADPEQASSSCSSREAAAAALKAAVACCEAGQADVRVAALAAVRAWLDGELGSCLLLGDASAAAAMFQTALLHLSDLHPPAAAAAEQLLVAAAAPLALSGASAANAGPSSCAADEAVAVALQRQQLGFSSAQLRQWLDYLEGSDGPAAVLTAAGQQAAPPLQQWLPRLLHSMRAVPTPGEQRSGPESVPVSWQLPSCLPQAAWWAVQEAAKQLVASRLRTHHGGPAQTLAALERAVQAAAGRLQQGAEDEAAGLAGRQQAAVLLQLFVFALEQGISCAAAGSGSSRAGAPQPASTFFAANDKVCQAWFARFRLPLAKAAAAAGLHELAAFHALRRLQDLRQQAAALVPAATAAAQAGGAVGETTTQAAAATAGQQASPVPPETPLAGKQERRLSAGQAAGSEAVNPAAALLAATRGSPDVTLRQGLHAGTQAEPGSPAAAARSRQLSRQQLQAAAAKVAETAAAAASALCALGDADGIAGLQSFCRQAFQPLLLRLQGLGRAGPEADQAAGDPDMSDAAASAAAAAWDWLAAVQQQAAGQYEAAVQQYLQLFGPGAQPGMQCVPAAALARLAAEAYAAVGDSGGLSAWLQGKLGSRLPPAAAARCLHLARWEIVGEQEPAADAPGESSLLTHLQLPTLDPTAPAIGASLPAAAGPLVALVAAGGSGKQMQQQMRLQLQLPAEQLLSVVAAHIGRSSQQAELGAWHVPGDAPGAEAISSPQALLQLLSMAGLAEEQRQPLLLAAAQAATASGNSSCAGRLLACAEALLSEDGVSSGSRGARLLLQLLRLQADPAEVSPASAWQLLLAARDGDTTAARAVAPAAAVLLLSQQAGPQVALSAAELSGLVQSCQLPGLGTGGTAAVAALEQQLLTGQRERQLAHTAEHAALKAAVAAAPSAASSWWRWAEWLTGLQQREAEGSGVASAAGAVAFTASCRALALAGAGSSGGSSGGGGYGALPALLSVMQHITQPGSTHSSLPSDAAAQLAAVPASAWLPVVPHLLSHLAATVSDPPSQQLVLGLLVHIAAAAPCQVLLPALVAAEASGGPAAGTPQLVSAAAPLQQLLDTLRQLQPQLAQQLSVLMSEAARLAVLPAEHWHTVLQEAAATAARRLQQQQQKQLEAGAGEGDSGARFAALAPVLLCLQQQLEAAEGPAPETPHERRFQQQQLPKLRQLVQRLAEQVAGTASEPGGQKQPGAVALLRAAAAEMGAALRQRQLALAEVAPALSSLADTFIPIPGAAPGPAGVPELAGVAAEVAVLATKTRPKRLRFLGSDGQEHAFLLKGREDLRADARLMHMLRACHAALQAPGARCAGSCSGAGDLAVHCFEVTPLGGRLGLVQWVEGAVPLYELYTGWQQARAQRQRWLAAAAATSTAQQQQPAPAPVHAARGGRVLVASRAARAAGTAGAVQLPAVAQQQRQPQQQQQLRPIDLFYAKLKEVGIDPASPRHAWPLPKLVRVLRSMQQSVDRQLLWRELWLGAGGAADWWARQHSFAASAAAMSMVGHLLGLGDRHLDNMLLHRRGGHLLHIDFSVVFDRGLQLKVPEVVPFRLTQTLVDALGVAGPDGRFRLGCERTLRTLRANAAPLTALLEAALLDAGVDWDAEAAAKAASKAFTWAVALQLFALRQAGASAELSSAAGAARSALAAASATLDGYVQQFLAMARTAASAAESHALLQRCRTTLDTAAAQEQQLAGQEQQGRTALVGVLADAQPVAAQVLAALQECQAWQQRHEALLPLLVGNPPAALLLGAPAWDPAAATAAGAAPSLLLVSAGPGSSGEVGTGSILHGTLGMLPSQAPLSASLLLQAAAVDSQGQQLLQERAAAAAQLAAALQQFGAASACLLGGPRYAGSSQHTHWLVAFQAAMELPVPQGFERAAQLAPQPPNPGAALAAWRPLAVAATAACGLAEQLASTAAALQLERVDVALAAGDAKQRLLEAADDCWAAAPGGDQAESSGAAALALAFAALSEEQAGAVLQLQRSGGANEEEEAGAAGAAADEVPAVLEHVQRLVLGYTSTAVAVRDATSEELFSAPDGSNVLGWLAQAVQAVDSLSTAAAEAQLLLPQLLALLHTEAGAAEVSAVVAAAAEQLGTVAEAEEQTAAAAMQPLLEAAGQHPPFSTLLQCLQRTQTAAQLLLPAEQQPSLAQLQLLLAGAAVAVWQGLEEAVDEAAEEEQAASGSPAVAAVAAAASATVWQRCSAVLAAAVAAEVEQHLVPPLAAALAATAQQLRAAAPSLARLAGLEGMAAVLGQPADGSASAAGGAAPDLVPFTAFDDELPGAGELLGSLEDELGSVGSPATAGGHTPADQQPGGAAELVPFLDFDDSLAGAGDLLESLEPAVASEFEGASPAGSQPQLSQLGVGGSLSQRSEEWDGIVGGQSAGASLGWRQLAVLLAAATEASGALAAVDAVQYVSGLALQQAQQLRQQHCAELAACQWANEHLLPPEAAAAAASLLSNVTLSAAAAAAAGAALPPVHPAVAAWVLCSSRQQVLQQLEAGSATLLSLEAPLQQWQRSLAAVQRQLSDEVAAAMPFAAGDLQQALGQQQQWLAAAAAHTANLLEVAQAVLQLEASRTADTAAAGSAAAVAGPEQQQQPAAAQPADRYSAEQREGWQRYMALLQQMQQLHGAYTAADRAVAAAAGELQQLALRRQEATAIAQSAEEAGSNAAAVFAASALQLVKATQQLPTAMAQLLPKLAGATEWAGQLVLSQRWAAELAAAAADGEGSGVGKAATTAAEQLAAAAACARQLPAAVEQLQAALLPVRNRLLAGGRGEAAAQQQAADVVDALSAAVTELHPQLEQVEQLQQWLADLPASLQGLASQAGNQAAALQSRHGFSLRGLEQLLERQGGTSPSGQPAYSDSSSSRASGGRALSGSLLLTARPPQQEAAERRQYAASVLQSFRAKLQGQGARTAAGNAATHGAASSGEAAEVAEEVHRLIAAATSADNLARMWEGWMAWV